ncbi:MAG TPA: hypothetical protein VFZ00_28365 [Solirubrobacter sp.]|nr:hypothetical protein [Solirubrobacter sp.]
MSRITAQDRAVLRCEGVAVEAAAQALGLTVEQVRTSRDRLGRDLEDGTPCGVTPTRAGHHLDTEDFDVLMRANRSVCG